MTELLIFWGLVLALATALATLRDIHDDGHGRRPAPPSHLPDAFDPHTRIRPF